MTQLTSSRPQKEILQLVLDGADVLPDEFGQVHGFGGLHGGVAAALLLGRMRAQVPDSFRPVEMNTHFIAPTRNMPDITASALRSGRRSAQLRADAIGRGGELLVTADAVFAEASAPGAGNMRAIAPRMPTGVTPADAVPPFSIAREFMPLGPLLEIRPATATLPYSGSDVAELCAWIRLKADVPDTISRLLILIDALAPSYAAVLDQLAQIPTVRMSVHFAAEAPDAEFDRVLLRARTPHADHDGWLSETVDLWSEDGLHLASSTQLRRCRA